MSGFYISLERPIEGVDALVDGKGIHSADTKLEKLSKKLGVTPLMEFFSCSPEEIAQFDVEDTDAPPAKFFDAKEGLKTVHALRTYLEKNPKELKESAWILQDLKEFEHVLSKAAELGVGWHLSIDM